MAESSEEEPFILASLQLDSEDVMELPLEADGTVLLTTVQAQFPAAVGLKYRSPTGGWRGIKADNNVLAAPNSGWGSRTYIVTESDALKRPAKLIESARKEIEATKAQAKKCWDDEYEPRSKTAKLLDDMIVLGLPYSATEQSLKEYFDSACGDVTFCQVKMDRSTGKSRGFGFVRFKTVEAAEKAMNESHEMDGRKLVVRLSQREGDTPTKLFVGRLPSDTTEEQVKSYFADFGTIVDIYCPKPCRGFAFITFADENDAKKVLEGEHTLRGQRILVNAAESKSKRDQMEQDTPENDVYYQWSNNDGYNTYGNNSDTQQSNNYGDPYRDDSYRNDSYRTKSYGRASGISGSGSYGLHSNITSKDAYGGAGSYRNADNKPWPRKDNLGSRGTNDNYNNSRGGSRGDYNEGSRGGRAGYSGSSGGGYSGSSGGGYSGSSGGGYSGSSRGGYSGSSGGGYSGVAGGEKGGFGGGFRGQGGAPGGAASGAPGRMGVGSADVANQVRDMLLSFMTGRT